LSSDDSKELRSNQKIICRLTIKVDSTEEKDWIDIKLDLDNVFEVGGYVFYFDEEKKQYYQLKTKFKEIKKE